MCVCVCGFDIFGYYLLTVSTVDIHSPYWSRSVRMCVCVCVRVCTYVRSYTFEIEDMRREQCSANQSMPINVIKGSQLNSIGYVCGYQCPLCLLVRLLPTDIFSRISKSCAYIACISCFYRLLIPYRKHLSAVHFWKIGT